MQYVLIRNATGLSLQHKNLLFHCPLAKQVVAKQVPVVAKQTWLPSLTTTTTLPRSQMQDGVRREAIWFTVILPRIQARDRGTDSLNGLMHPTWL
jgi:hypothetical protein